MKKWVAFPVMLLCGAALVFPSIITNSNQSAQYFRLLSRNPSNDIDAVYYNPAGLTKLANGWHFSLSNQTIFQEKKIDNLYPLLNNGKYAGKTTVPFFPNAYVVYKKDRLAFSFGFGPNGGGGSADYERGLPSFETDIATLPLLVNSMIRRFGGSASAYSADINFKGSSIFLGFQGNVSYAVSDAFSVAAGVRYISAKNTYEGEIKNIKINASIPLLGINPTAQLISAPQFFTMLGQPVYAAATSDKTVDAEQSATGLTPILSLNLNPVKGLTISAKYEFITKLTLVNETTKDDTGMFPDGVKTHRDIPAILSLGVGYALLPQWRVISSFNQFFDKDVNWDGEEKLINHNTYELSFGTEVDVNSWLTLSAGYLRTQFDLSDAYKSDLTFDPTSNAVAAGARLKLGRFEVNLGVLNSFYIDEQKMIQYPIGTYAEKYSKTTTGFAIGVDYHF
jgi:long-chain fatty acid transport protein